MSTYGALDNQEYEQADHKDVLDRHEKKNCLK